MKFIFKSLVGLFSKKFDAQNSINTNNCFSRPQVDHLHDFVRETSLTTEEWMYANDFNLFLFCYPSHCLDLAIGRPLISSLRQGRCALIFVKVFQLLFRFMNGSLILSLRVHIVI